MSYKWSKGEPLTSNITDATMFNEAHDNYKGALNGNLNRDNIPQQSVNRAELKNNAAHAVSLTYFNMTDGAYQAYPTSSTGFRGFTYKQYQSGWQPLTSVSGTLKEGILHIELSGIISIYKDFDNYGCKIADLKVTYNGMDVCISPQYSQSIMPVHAVADVACAEGAADIRVFWRLTPPYSKDEWFRPWIYFTGGSLLLINRYR
tara:strand:+ start:420 stop:1031 length:612 start_codon:yes stop_codon:yes gene_type:complete